MIRSNLDTLTCVGLSGWAVDSEIPSKRLMIKVIINGVCSEVQADQRRIDLVPAGVATDAFHGFSARIPIHAWGVPSTVELMAIDHAGRDWPILSKRAIPNYPGLVMLTNGLLSAWFSTIEGGTLVGLRSAEFPHADNMIDNSSLYGRCIQLDLYNDGQNDLNQPIPTEGGWEGDGMNGGSPIMSAGIQKQGGRDVFVCVSKIREWVGGKVSEWSLIRNTWLDGNTVVSRFQLRNGYPEVKPMIWSNNWILNPDVLNTYVHLKDDQVWEADPAFTETTSPIATIYDLWEGKDGMALSHSVFPRTKLFFDVPDTIGTAYPRCSFAGWREFGVVMQPQAMREGWNFTTVTMGTEASRTACAAAMQRAGIS